MKNEDIIRVEQNAAKFLQNSYGGVCGVDFENSGWGLLGLVEVRVSTNGMANKESVTLAVLAAAEPSAVDYDKACFVLELADHLAHCVPFDRAVDAILDLELDSGSVEN